MTSHLANYPIQQADNEAILHARQRDAFSYFLHEANLANGLVADKTELGAPASIAAMGFALAAYPVGVEHAAYQTVRTTGRLRLGPLLARCPLPQRSSCRR